MSKILITTIDDLQKIVTTQNKLNDSFVIYTFYQKDTMIPAQCLNMMINSGTQIHFKEYSEPEEMFVKVGFIMGENIKDNEFFILNKTISLTKDFIDEYKISEVSLTSLFSAKSNNTAKTSSKKKTTTENKDVKPYTGKKRGRKPKVLKEDSKSVNLSVEKNTANKDLFDLKKDNTSANQKSLNKDTDSNTSTDSFTAASTNSLDNSDDIITTFVKQMSVKSSDLSHYVGTNEQLAQDIAASINDYKKMNEELMECLLKNFSNEDSSVIYHWIKPNIKRLLQLSEKIAQPVL